jgi:outer membrane lipoprotein-sorting protein
MYSMKKKITVLGIICVLIFAVLSLVACSSKSATSQTGTMQTTSSTATTAVTTSKSATATTAVTTSNTTSAGSVADLFGRAAGIASMKYDMVTTAADNSVMNSTAFLKRNKMRIESIVQGQNTVMLIDGDAKTMYVYTPAQNTAMKMDFSQAPQSATGSVSQYNPVIVGSETLDGKLCQIIQYTANGVVTKEWVWDAKGLPVRVQATSSAGASTTDFKNYDFSDIPDSMFVLPAGVQITSFNLPTNLPTGIPTNLPTGLPTNLPTNLPTK